MFFLIDLSDDVEDQSRVRRALTESVKALTQSPENGNSSLAGNTTQRSIDVSELEEQARRAQEYFKPFDAAEVSYTVKDPFQRSGPELIESSRAAAEKCSSR